MAEELQGILNRINADGIAKADAERNAIIEKAKAEAAKIVSDAKGEAAEIVKNAQSEAEAFENARIMLCVRLPVILRSLSRESLKRAETNPFPELPPRHLLLSLWRSLSRLLLTSSSLLLTRSCQLFVLSRMSMRSIPR